MPKKLIVTIERTQEVKICVTVPDDHPPSAMYGTKVAKLIDRLTNSDWDEINDPVVTEVENWTEDLDEECCDEVDLTPK